VRHITPILLTVAVSCAGGLDLPCAAENVFRIVFQADGWQIPQDLAGCPSTTLGQAEVSGTALKLLELDRSCISRKDVVEQMFRSNGKLRIDSRPFRIVAATRYERHGSTVMLRVELAPVAIGDPGGVVGAVLRFYYVVSVRGGPFDLRFEQFGEPDLPDWAKN